MYKAPKMGSVNNLARLEVTVAHKWLLGPRRNNKSPDTQLQAIEAIVDLVSSHPALSAAFRQRNAGKDLREVHPDTQRAGNLARGTLYARTRQALASVEEVEVLQLVCKMNIAQVLASRESKDIAEQLCGYVK